MRAAVAISALVGIAVILACFTAQGKILFHDKFDNLDSWVQSEHRSDYGKVALSAGKSFVNEEAEKGLQLTEDARFYAVSRKLPAPIDNNGKSLVISFSVKNEQNLACGGCYIKLISELDQKNFSGDSPYWLMFGPDRCGGTNKIHIIFNYKGKNWEFKKTYGFPRDTLTHVYTLEIRRDSTYELFVDGVSKTLGNMDEDWNFFGDRKIYDPNAKKPDDWVDEETIPDPDDVKPADWDDEPATIEDATAEKPVDWDEKKNGEWKRPSIANPKFKGVWEPKRIPNPKFKGFWKADIIDNPDFHFDPTVYHTPAPLQYVGIDVWQVEAGSIFNNIIIGDDTKEVLELVKSTYGKIAEEEKAKAEAAQKAKEEEEKAKAAQDEAEKVKEGEAEAKKAKETEVDMSADDSNADDTGDL